MKRCAVLYAVLARRAKLSVFKKAAVLNRAGYAREVLKHNAACTDVCVPYLRVAHLPVRETDSKA